MPETMQRRGFLEKILAGSALAATAPAAAVAESLSLTPEQIQQLTKQIDPAEVAYQRLMRDVKAGDNPSLGVVATQKHLIPEAQDALSRRGIDFDVLKWIDQILVDMQNTQLYLAEAGLTHNMIEGTAFSTMSDKAIALKIRMRSPHPWESGTVTLRTIKTYQLFKDDPDGSLLKSKAHELEAKVIEYMTGVEPVFEYDPEKPLTEAETQKYEAKVTPAQKVVGDAYWNAGAILCGLSYRKEKSGIPTRYWSQALPLLVKGFEFNTQNNQMQAIIGICLKGKQRYLDSHLVNK